MFVRLAASDALSVQHFNELWVNAFRTTKGYDHWNRVTDPVLFDIVEPKSVPIFT